MLTLQLVLCAIKRVALVIFSTFHINSVGGEVRSAAPTQEGDARGEIAFQLPNNNDHRGGEVMHHSSPTS